MKTQNTVSVYRKSVQEMNDFLASMPKKLKNIPTCVKYYGPYRTGIISARKNGHTNESIALALWNERGVGPRSYKSGEFSIKTAAAMISTFINNY